eukprot:96273-Prorocentrum_minimum.AAC.3
MVLDEQVVHRLCLTESGDAEPSARSQQEGGVPRVLSHGEAASSQRGSAGSTTPVARKFGVHTGLKGGWRPAAASSIELLAAVDTACEAAPTEHNDASDQPQHDALRALNNGEASDQPQHRSEGPDALLALMAAASRTSGLPGHFVIERFVSEAEEAAILRVPDPFKRGPFPPFVPPHRNTVGSHFEFLRAGAFKRGRGAVFATVRSPPLRTPSKLNLES